MNIKNKLFVGLSLASVFNPFSSQAKEKEKMNIVFMFVDDLGWADVGYRNPKFQTPNIDKLNDDGMCFSRAYVAQPASSPSRAALLTGHEAVRLQMVRHIDDKFAGQKSEFSMYPDDPAMMPSRNWLPLEEKTFAEKLKEYGYHNMFIGKWHLGGEKYWPNHQGFDETYGLSEFGNVSSYYAPFFKFKSGDDSTKGVAADNEYMTDFLTTRAVDFISGYNRKEPFMMTMFYYNVHTPNKGRTDLVEMYRSHGMSEVDANYAAQVTAVDQSVGSLRKALEDKGIADKTVIVFFSDQGGYFSNAPLRGCKKIEDTLAEGGIRVPLTIYYPGVTAKGSSCDVPVSAIDMYPTLSEIASGRKCTDKAVTGVSILPLLQGKSIKDRNLYIFRSYIDQYVTMINGDWKIIKWHTGKYQMYNLRNDESETTNLMNVEVSRFNKMKKELHDWESEAVPVYENDYRKRFNY